MKHGAAELRAEPQPATEAPAVVPPPGLSQPSPVTRKGRHFGPRPVDDPRTAWLSTRCTPTFRAIVVAAAKDAGLSLADHVHTRLGGSPGPRARRNPGPDTVLLAKVLAELGKSGSNLNQIAYQLNLGEDAELPELRETLTEHRAAVAAVMRVLGA
jgi:hypothetical protein